MSRPLLLAGATIEDLCEPVSLVSFFLIASLTIAEFMEYRKVTMKPAIVVDKSRGEKLVVNLNVTFPRVPCYRACLACFAVSS